MTGQVNDQRPLVVTEGPGGVITLTMNRPDVGNAYDAAMLAAFREAVEQAGDAGARAVVVRGRGRHFQAGADLAWMSAVREGSAASNLAASKQAARMFQELNALPCPLVAAVHGACLGGGTGIVAAADVVVATTSAFFSIAEVRWGLQPGIIIPLLNDAMGSRQVRRYALTGERFSAAEARRLGLVHEVVDEASLDAEVERVLAQLLRNAPTAVAVTKRHVRESSWSEATEEAAVGLAISHATTRREAEAEEGMRAFAERRPPAWVPPHVLNRQEKQETPS